MADHQTGQAVDVHLCYHHHRNQQIRLIREKDQIRFPRKTVLTADGPSKLTLLPNALDSLLSMAGLRPTTYLMSGTQFTIVTISAIHHILFSLICCLLF